MESQEWIPVTNRRSSKKNTNSVHDTTVDNKPEEVPIIQYRIAPESIQQLIRKRIHMRINQEKADIICQFPKYTFKNIESNRLLPNESQIQRISRLFDIQLKTEVIV
jgi:ribosome-binding protein aMBF1 (putative translation factor)